MRFLCSVALIFGLSDLASAQSWQLGIVYGQQAFLEQGLRYRSPEGNFAFTAAPAAQYSTEATVGYRLRDGRWLFDATFGWQAYSYGNLGTVRCDSELVRMAGGAVSLLQRYSPRDQQYAAVGATRLYTLHRRWSVGVGIRYHATLASKHPGAVSCPVGLPSPVRPANTSSTEYTYRHRRVYRHAAGLRAALNYHLARRWQLRVATNFTQALQRAYADVVTDDAAFETATRRFRQRSVGVQGGLVYTWGR